MPETVSLPHDLSATPTHVLQSDRYIRVYWVQPDATPDAFGCTMHTTLTFDHDETVRGSGKQYTAVLSEAPALFREDGTHRESFSLRNPPERVLLASEPAPRYNARRFAAFVHSILGGNLPS